MRFMLSWKFSATACLKKDTQKKIENKIEAYVSEKMADVFKRYANWESLKVYIDFLGEFFALTETSFGCYNLNGIKRKN